MVRKLRGPQQKLWVLALITFREQQEQVATSVRVIGAPTVWSRAKRGVCSRYLAALYLEVFKCNFGLLPFLYELTYLSMFFHTAHHNVFISNTKPS